MEDLEDNWDQFAVICHYCNENLPFWECGFLFTGFVHLLSVLNSAYQKLCVDDLFDHDYSGLFSFIIIWDWEAFRIWLYLGYLEFAFYNFFKIFSFTKNFKLMHLFLVFDWIYRNNLNCEYLFRLKEKKN